MFSANFIYPDATLFSMTRTKNSSTTRTTSYQIELSTIGHRFDPCCQLHSESYMTKANVEAPLFWGGGEDIQSAGGLSRFWYWKRMLNKRTSHTVGETNELLMQRSTYSTKHAVFQQMKKIDGFWKAPLFARGTLLPSREHGCVQILLWRAVAFTVWQ